MGLSLFSSAGRAASGTRAPCDPIPSSFVIRHVYEGAQPPVPKVRGTVPRVNVKRLWSKGDYLLAEIVYPNCPTFEGRKLILFEGVTAKWLRAQTAIDPHFSEGGHIIARFAPTVDGLRLAKRYLA